MKYNIDIEQIAKELEFDLDETYMLVDLFLETAIEDLERLKYGIELDSLDDIIESAHSIKGSASNLMLIDIQELAKEIELSARVGETIDYKSKYLILSSMINSIKSIE